MSVQVNDNNLVKKKESITESQDCKEKDQISSDDIFMQSDIVDQLNYNQQSNMALSAYSIITQSFSTVNINFASDNTDKEG